MFEGFFTTKRNFSKTMILWQPALETHNVWREHLQASRSSVALTTALETANRKGRTLLDMVTFGAITTFGAT